jgi:hypothetical protein
MERTNKPFPTPSRPDEVNASCWDASMSATRSALYTLAWKLDHPEPSDVMTDTLSQTRPCMLTRSPSTHAEG